MTTSDPHKENPTGIPSEINKTVTGPIAIILTNNRERLLSWFRWIICVSVALLIVGDVVVYSLYKSLQAKVENHERKLERIINNIDHLILAKATAEKIEKMEQQIDSINNIVGELTKDVKKQEK